MATGAAEAQVCTTTCLAGKSGSAPGEFENATYVAVDAATHDVYAADPTADLVSKFDSEGNLIATWGNNGKGGEPNGQLNGSPSEPFNQGLVGTRPIDGITVDSSGNLWVFDNDGQLFKFDQSSKWLANCAPVLGFGPGNGGMTVNGAGELYVVDGGGGVQRFKPSCASPLRLTSSNPKTWGLSADAFDNDLYVDAEGAAVEDIPVGCVPTFSGCAASQTFGVEGPGMLSGAAGVAVDSEPGSVYVANGSSDQIFQFALADEAISSPPEKVEAHSAILRGAVNPVGTELSRCRFEYGATEQYGQSVPCEESVESIGTGNSLVPVQAKVEGLVGGTEYHFRLHAGNVNAEVRSEDAHFTTLPTARIEGVAASKVTATSATLGATVNPESVAETRYHFEYGACASVATCPSDGYEKRVPASDVSLPSETKRIELSQGIEGLIPGVTYHFRIVVNDSNGEATPSPEATFVFASSLPTCSSPPPQSGELPDCRGYEMVTPSDKNGALVDNGVFLSAPSFSKDGSRALVKSIQCFHSPTSCVGVRQTEGEPFAFERSETGWKTIPLAPPATTAGNTMLSYNADSGLVLYALPSASPEGLEEFFVRRGDGTLEPIGPIRETPGSGFRSVANAVVVTTSDDSHVVYESKQFWPSFDGGGIAESVYEYMAPARHPVLVGVTGPEKESTSLIGTCGTQIGGDRNAHSAYGSLSADGRSIFFTVIHCAAGGTGANKGVPVPVDALYMRTELPGGQMRTVLLSASAPESLCHASCQKATPGDASFQGASTNGTHVYFTSTQQLTDNASEDSHLGDSAFVEPGCTGTTRSASGCNLYEWECSLHCEGAGEEHLVDVSAGDISGLGPQVQGVMAVPSEGSAVYFVAHGVLTKGPNKDGREPVEGGENLYVYGPGEGGGDRVAFVATLSEADSAEWNQGMTTANVTPDGRYLVFVSRRALTPDVSRAEGPAQVYRYDAASEHLLRVSIGRQGFRDNGNESTVDARIAPSVLAYVGGNGPGRADPTMADNGQLVFFESPAGLTTNALNDQLLQGNKGTINPHALAENVYEWEALGAQPSANAPACSEPGGCVALISDGRDVTEGSNAHENLSAVELLGADPTGANVFFETADQLVAGDTDSQVDIYDARVDGGFPASAETDTSAPCMEFEECRTWKYGGLVFGAPPSNVFSGLGNLAPGTEEKPPPLAPHSTPAQRLSLALKACRRKSGAASRTVCERKARATYRAQLLKAALAACHRKHGSARTRCERAARARYRSAKGARRGVARGRP